MTGPRLMGLDEGTQSTDPIYISENKLYVATYVWDSGSLAWVKATQASGGGGSVTVTNFPASQTVDDGGLSITVDGPLTDAELRATPVPVSGTFWQATQPVSFSWLGLTDTELRASPVPVSGTFWQATQPVSFTWSGLTDAELRASPVPVSGTISTTSEKASTPSQSSPSVTVASTVVLASNASRLGATIYNEGSEVCYLKLGSTASTTSYSVQLVVGAYYEVPFGYTGAIDGITSTSTAQLRVTEFT